MFRESRLHLAFLLFVLIPPVAAAPVPAIYLAVLGVILFIVLVAIAARLADRYHLLESIKKPGHEGYPEDDGRFEMKVFKGYGLGNDDDVPTPVMYEKRKHKKRGLTYQELAAAETQSVASEQRSQAPAEKPPKISKKERKEEKERKLREELHRSLSKDEKLVGKIPALPEAEVAVSPRQPRSVTSPSHKRPLSPPIPPPKPRTEVPTSPSQKRAFSPPPRGQDDPLSPPSRTKTAPKTPLSPKPRVKTPLSPQTPKRTQPRSAHNTLPARGTDQPVSSEPVTPPAGYHYPTMPAGYLPPHPGGYPPVSPAGAYPVYPYPHPGVPAYPAYPPQVTTPESGTPPVPVQPAAYHMPYPYPHPGYYPPHPGYPSTTPASSQSKQSQL